MEDYTLTEMIMDVITDEPMTAKEIASAVGVKFFAGKMGYIKRKSVSNTPYSLAERGKILKLYNAEGHTVFTTIPKKPCS